MGGETDTTKTVVFLIVGGFLDVVAADYCCFAVIIVASISCEVNLP